MQLCGRSDYALEVGLLVMCVSGDVDDGGLIGWGRFWDERWGMPGTDLW
jgi:hypothetical protein